MPTYKGQPIPQVTEYMYLGILLDLLVTMLFHVNMMLKRGRRRFSLPRHGVFDAVSNAVN